MEQAAQKLALEYSELGRVIKGEDVPGLIKSLQKRLLCSENELDISPDSLKHLEEKLIVYHKQGFNNTEESTHKDLVKLIREVAAYVGQVMVLAFDGNWNNHHENLWASSVTILRKVTTIKDNVARRSPRRGFAAVHRAAYFWDIIGTGEEKDFFNREFEYMAKGVWKEKL